MGRRTAIAYAVMAGFTALVLVGADALGLSQLAAYVVLGAAAVPLGLVLIVFIQDDWALLREARAQRSERASRRRVGAHRSRSKR